ncbi:MAG: DUF2809 domain-containing protein [Proteobacteria bacterium]|nr:DUF2809 domain-containing protein [Pseudomonadota bacterium]
MKTRLTYLIIFILLVAIEVCIALFVHDSIIRPYGGDVIVVWVIYCLVQMILGGNNNHYIIAIAVMLFAYIVEFLQMINIVDLLGMGHIHFIKILVGSTFSISDLVCYSLGTAAMLAGIRLHKKKFVMRNG